MNDDAKRHFADQLILRTRFLGHPLCVGLDPHIDAIPELFRRGSMNPADPYTAIVVENFLTAIIDRIVGRVAIVKPQLAFFEHLGWRGIQVLDNIASHASARNLLVLLDAKRGDVGSTAAAYAGAYVAPGAPVAGDAITVNPYLGRDSLAPFLDAASGNGTGLFALVKTSNPGSCDYQDLVVKPAVEKSEPDLHHDQPLFAAMARSFVDQVESLRGPETGWSSFGIVVGATYPAQADLLRDILPRAPFLVPGYGSQGGSAEDAVRSFVAGPAGPEGGIVNSSRAILFPPAGATDDLRRWETVIDDTLARAIGDLVEALAKRR